MGYSASGSDAEYLAASGQCGAGVLERTGHATSTTVRVIMRNEREREKRKRTSMGTRSAGAGEVRPGAQAQWVLSSLGRGE